jgi:hypothetical protein
MPHNHVPKSYSHKSWQVRSIAPDWISVISWIIINIFFFKKKKKKKIIFVKLWFFFFFFFLSNFIIFHDTIEISYRWWVYICDICDGQWSSTLFQINEEYLLILFHDRDLKLIYLMVYIMSYYLNILKDLLILTSWHHLNMRTLIIAIQ